MKPVICLLKSFATLWKGNCAIELMKMHLKGIKLSLLERQTFAIMLTCDQKSCFKLYLWASFPSQLNSTKGTNNKEKLFNVQICIGNSNRGNTGCVCAALIFYSTMKGLTTKINEIVRIFFIFLPRCSPLFCWMFLFFATALVWWWCVAASSPEYNKPTHSKSPEQATAIFVLLFNYSKSSLFTAKIVYSLTLTFVPLHHSEQQC